MKLLIYVEEQLQLWKIIRSDAEFIFASISSIIQIKSELGFNVVNKI